MVQHELRGKKWYSLLSAKAQSLSTRKDRELEGQETMWSDFTLFSVEFIQQAGWSVADLLPLSPVPCQET